MRVQPAFQIFRLGGRELAADGHIHQVTFPVAMLGKTELTVTITTILAKHEGSDSALNGCVGSHGAKGKASWSGRVRAKRIRWCREHRKKHKARNGRAKKLHGSVGYDFHSRLWAQLMAVMRFENVWISSRSASTKKLERGSWSELMDRRRVDGMCDFLSTRGFAEFSKNSSSPIRSCQLRTPTDERPIKIILDFDEHGLVTRLTPKSFFGSFSFFWHTPHQKDLFNNNTSLSIIETKSQQSTFLKSAHTTNS